MSKKCGAASRMFCNVISQGMGWYHSYLSTDALPRNESNVFNSIDLQLNARSVRTNFSIDILFSVPMIKVIF